MASDKILKVKEAAVADLAEDLKQAKTIVLAEYLGLTVAEDTELRKNLRDGDVTYKVIKNNIGKRAVEEAGYAELADSFVGPTAIAYSEDVVAPAKILKDFSKEHEILQLKAGASDGVVLSAEALNALASVPGVDELYARLARGVAWPFTNLAMLIKALADKVEENGAELAKDVVEESTTEDEDSEDSSEAEAKEETAEAEEKAEPEAKADDNEKQEDNEEAEASDKAEEADNDADSAEKE